ncbi:MAG: hypothetical protein KDH96_05830 [Candidatus Riesia sp.]|nr:hypothetical protein [Candidatus Riesia sp.]
MSYEHDMSAEKESSNVLLDKGWREFKVVSMMPKLSKQGNQMFVVSVEDTATRTVHDVYCVAEAGKRWVLKSLLTASGLVANDKGVFKWDIPDVVGRCVMGLVDHEPNSYINRAGDKVDAVQHKIIKFRIIEQSDIDKGEKTAWED